MYSYVNTPKSPPHSWFCKRPFPFKFNKGIDNIMPKNMVIFPYQIHPYRKQLMRVTTKYYVYSPIKSIQLLKTLQNIFTAHELSIEQRTIMILNLNILSIQWYHQPDEQVL
jgi:hypothetical protein